MAARPIQSGRSRCYATGLAGENPVCVTPIFFDKKNIKKGAKDQEETLIIASTEPAFVSRIAMVIKTFTISYFMER